jgi:hypothetical protein
MRRSPISPFRKFRLRHCLTLRAYGRYFQSSQHWSPTILFISFNDSFFMSLMFLISGLFFWQALTRKGVGRFLLARLVRLGIPFLVMIGRLSPDQLLHFLSPDHRA